MEAPMFFAEDELLDVVNEYDQIIGQEYRSRIYLFGKPNFRVINAFVVNNENKIWIPRRSAHKKLYPLALDASVGGHVKAGETYEQAFARELLEELNLTADEISYSLVGYLSPSEHNVSAHMHLYKILYNQTPHYNENDFIDSSWMAIDELDSCIAQGYAMKSDLPLLIKALKNAIF